MITMTYDDQTRVLWVANGDSHVHWDDRLYVASTTEMQCLLIALVLWFIKERRVRKTIFLSGIDALESSPCRLYSQVSIQSGKSEYCLQIAAAAVILNQYLNIQKREQREDVPPSQTPDPLFFDCSG